MDLNVRALSPRQIRNNRLDHRQPGRCIGLTGVLLQGRLTTRNKDDLIEIRLLPCILGDEEMPPVRRVKTPAKQTEALG